jgi:DNA-binding CsgD family transcriptional regulator
MASIKPAVTFCQQKLDINTFGYRRFLINGKSFGCSNNINWNKTCAEHFTGIYIPEYASDLNCYLATGQAHLIRQGIPYSKSTFLRALYESDIWNTLCIYQKNINSRCIEAFFFGTTRNNIKIVEFYIEKINFIHSWIQSIKPQIQEHFKKNTRLLFANTIIEETCLNNIETAFLEPLPMGNLILSKFSKRERALLELLMQGHKRRQIALALNVAPKTVDAMFEHIKYKTNTHSKKQFFKCFPLESQLSFLENNDEKSM